MRALFPGAPQWAIHSKVNRFWGVCVVIANERKNKLIDIRWSASLSVCSQKPIL